MSEESSKLIDWVLLTEEGDDDKTYSFPFQQIPSRGSIVALTSAVVSISQLTAEIDGDVPQLYLLAMTRPELAAAIARELNMDDTQFMRCLILLIPAADAIEEITRRVSQYVYNDPSIMLGRVIYTGVYTGTVDVTPGDDGDTIVRTVKVTGRKLIESGLL